MVEMSMIMSALGAFVCICAILAAYGFKGRITTIGVDLGTTLSVVGINYGNGDVRIVTDKEGRRMFPSIVYYPSSSSSKVLTLHDAVPYLDTHPENTIYNAKRFIGRSLDENIAVRKNGGETPSGDVFKYASEHPFHTVTIANSSDLYSKIGFQIHRKTSADDKSSGSSSITVTPIEVAAEVLKGLLAIVSGYLKHSQVNKAVAAVPAKFTSEQRIATSLAYKKAGLKVVRIIDEPTAAAVAYKLHKKSNIHNILVYDFGGGTLDVSLLYVSNGSVQVYATDGDDTLGGSDLDQCMYHIIYDKLVDAGIAVESLKPSVIRANAEEVKKALSYTIEYTMAYNTSEAQVYPKIAITRDEFHTECSSLFKRCLLPVIRLLSELSMITSDIDEVVLVGGSTRIPHVKELLNSYFDRKVNINDSIDPDVTVAYGAASILD